MIFRTDGRMMGGGMNEHGTDVGDIFSATMLQTVRERERAYVALAAPYPAYTVNLLNNALQAGCSWLAGWLAG